MKCKLNYQVAVVGVLALLWGMAALAVSPPPPIEMPQPVPVATPAPPAAAPRVAPQVIGTPPPSNPFAPLESKMASIPAGSFTMGCVNGRDNVEGVKKCEGAETPAHQVTLSGFRLGKAEVTFAEWDVCVADGACPKIDSQDNGWGRGNRPVINVSWDDTQTYIQWINKRTGKNYRLPTEAEWEYAARGDQKRGDVAAAYPWGFAIGCSNAAYNYKDCGNEKTKPVGSYAANGYGLYDMQGNVWEWCQDNWHDNYQGAPSTGIAWAGGDGTHRVLRGGSWFINALGARSANRNDRAPDYRSDDVGFRLALP